MVAMFRSSLPRLTKATIVGGLAALVAVWFRSREPDADDPVPGVAEWPPIAHEPGVDISPDATRTADNASTVDAEPGAIAEPSDGSAAPAPAGDWVSPEADGGCPISHPVKVKLRSEIYHMPQGASYTRTNADRCYGDPEAAEADGYRASKT